MCQGGHSEPLLLLALFYQSNPLCLKVMGGVGGGPFDYCVSPVQRIGFFGSDKEPKERGSCACVRVLCLLGLGIGDLDSGLTISLFTCNKSDDECDAAILYSSCYFNQIKPK